MRTIKLSDNQYELLEQRANHAGFPTVDEYLVSLAEPGTSEGFDFDAFLTPERMASIEVARQQLRNGDYCTVDELDDVLDKTRTAWLRENPGSR